MTQAGYSGTPLPRKLGIKEDSRVLIVNKPDGFHLDVLHDLEPTRQPYDVVLLFCPDLATLRGGFDEAAARHTTTGSVWVGWPKKSSGIATDISEGLVRDWGLAHGRVDVKVAALDPIWSGLKFVIRLADR